MNKQAKAILLAFMLLDKFLDEHGDEMGDSHGEWLDKLEEIHSSLEEGIRE